MRKTILSLALFTTLNFLHAEELLTPQTFTLTTTTDQNLTITETKEGFKFENFSNKAVLIALFGHQCPPCLREIPDFIKLTNDHPNDLAIIAIEVQRYPANKVKEFSKEHNMNYNVVAGINHSNFISYLADRAGLPNGIQLPFLIALNKDGEVEGTQAGRMRHDELEMLIKDLNE